MKFSKLRRDFNPKIEDCSLEFDKNRGMRSNCLDLPDHLLSMIFDKIVSADDFIRFSLVCVRLQSVFTQNHKKPFLPQLPLLLRRPENTRRIIHFAFTVSLIKRFVILSYRCLGLSIFVGQALGDPLRFSDYSLMAICHRGIVRLAFFKAGDKDWSFVKKTRWNVAPDDVLYYKCVFNVVNNFHMVVAIDIRPPQPKQILIADPAPDFSGRGVSCGVVWQFAAGRKD
ncbi:hypothetical protein GIB67_024319 [Kingdonia uniflora]|uniref:F-box domain-containing protein n=1 Tax=Kingdonia uniflora TaxID=39325 RepID=A0A7J7LF35_9MAGN|nr:hypothetical protein GIB67_024319 [Kingdonia uniflora]